MVEDHKHRLDIDIHVWVIRAEFAVPDWTIYSTLVPHSLVHKPVR